MLLLELRTNRQPSREEFAKFNHDYVARLRQASPLLSDPVPLSARMSRPTL
jgi:hypothetical protein